VALATGAPPTAKTPTSNAIAHEMTLLITCALRSYSSVKILYCMSCVTDNRYIIVLLGRLSVRVEPLQRVCCQVFNTREHLISLQQKHHMLAIALHIKRRSRRIKMRSIQTTKLNSLSFVLLAFTTTTLYLEKAHPDFPLEPISSALCSRPANRASFVSRHCVPIATSSSPAGAK
jgi:hypothetical protein